MFRKKPKPLSREEQPGDFYVTLKRRVDYDHVETITHIPTEPFQDIIEWCEEMGLVKPVMGSVFSPIHVVAGDSIEFSIRLTFTCGKAAMLYKLRFGGVGHIGVMGQATI